MKKIFIPKPNNDVAGPQTFLRNLTSYLERKNYPFTYEINEAAGLLCAPSYIESIIKDFKKKEGKIIQRLAGVYYPSKHGAKYTELNKEIQDIYENYANYFVFQSEYSKKQCFDMFGEVEEHKYSTIINGVNKEIFYPINKMFAIGEKVKIVTTGNFRSQDMIEPLTKALDLLVDDINLEFNIIGPVDDRVKHFFDKQYIHLLGEKSPSEINKLINENHIFIYSILNPACPNSVIEAISTGIPVVGLDTGSMSELVFFNKDLLSKVSDDLYHKYEDIDAHDLYEKIKLCIKDYSTYKDKAIEHSYLYSFKECGDQYIEVFDKILGNENIIHKILNILKK